VTVSRREVQAAVAVYDAILRGVPWEARQHASGYPLAAALAAERAKEDAHSLVLAKRPVILRRIDVQSIAVSTGHMAEGCARIALLVAVGIFWTRAVLKALDVSTSNPGKDSFRTIVQDKWVEEVYLLLEQVLEILLKSTFGSAWMFVVPHEPAVWIALGMLIGAVCMLFALKLANVAGRLCGVAIGVALNILLGMVGGIECRVDFKSPDDEHAPTAAIAAMHNVQ
jgi:hypothetical protein